MALLLVVLGGCKQRAFMTEAEYNRTVTTNLEDMEMKPDLSGTPLTEAVPPPPTLENLDRKVRFISLAECIAIALEQGTVGQPSLLFPGNALDNLVQFTGRGVSGSDAIRVLAVDPARAGAEIEGSLSKFDAYFVSSLQYQITDQPIGTPFQTFQAGNSGLAAIETTNATGSMQLLKPLATGGVAGITFNLPYNYTNLPARVNPNYQPQLLFQFEQPLLQGFGVEINQLRTAHPGSILNPNIANTNPTLEGILISRIRFDEQRAEFERNVNQMLLNAEVAYWNLYGAYWTLYSREQGLRFAYEAYKLSKARYEAGQVKAADFYQTRGQYELFRAQRIQAISTVLENERQLRALLGMNIEDCTRLMPSDSPTLAPYRPDWCSALQDALVKRPELYMARQEVKVAQANLILAKNSLLPDLRFTSSYDFNSIGGRLDGPVGNGLPADTNALKALSYGNFSDWSLGLRLIVPLGFRFGHVQVRQAQVSLARAMEQLKDQELEGAALPRPVLRADQRQLREHPGQPGPARGVRRAVAGAQPGVHRRPWHARHPAGSPAVLGRRPGERVRRHRHLQQQPGELGVRQGHHPAARQRDHRRGRTAHLRPGASGGPRTRADGRPGPSRTGRPRRPGRHRPAVGPDGSWRVAAVGPVGHAAAEGDPGPAGGGRAGQADAAAGPGRYEAGRNLHAGTRAGCGPGPGGAGSPADRCGKASGTTADGLRHGAVSSGQWSVVSGQQ